MLYEHLMRYETGVRPQKGQLEDMEHDFPKTIGRPATDALLTAGYPRLEHMAGVREIDIKRLHGVGPKAIKILRATLSSRGLRETDPAL